MAIYKHVGEVIKALRKRHGLTQAEFSRRVGVSNSEICRIEKGIRTPTKKTLIIIANYFKIHVDELLLIAGNDTQLELSITTKDDIIISGNSKEITMLRIELKEKSKAIKVLVSEVDSIVSKLLKII